jgi:hypothetical protein
MWESRSFNYERIKLPGIVSSDSLSTLLLRTEEKHEYWRQQASLAGLQPDKSRRSPAEIMSGIFLLQQSKWIQFVKHESKQKYFNISFDLAGKCKRPVLYTDTVLRITFGLSTCKEDKNGVTTNVTINSNTTLWTSHSDTTNSEPECFQVPQGVFVPELSDSVLQRREKMWPSEGCHLQCYTYKIRRVT